MDQTAQPSLLQNISNLVSGKGVEVDTVVKIDPKVYWGIGGVLLGLFVLVLIIVLVAKHA